MNITVSFDPVDGLGHSNGTFGVVNHSMGKDAILETSYVSHLQKSVP